MKDTKIIIDRDEWEKLREYRKAPFKKRYLEIIESGYIIPDLKII